MCSSLYTVTVCNSAYFCVLIITQQARRYCILLELVVYIVKALTMAHLASSCTRKVQTCNAAAVACLSTCQLASGFSNDVCDIVQPALGWQASHQPRIRLVADSSDNAPFPHANVGKPLLRPSKDLCLCSFCWCCLSTRPARNGCSIPVTRHMCCVAAALAQEKVRAISGGPQPPTCQTATV